MPKPLSVAGVQMGHAMVVIRCFARLVIEALGLLRRLGRVLGEQLLCVTLWL